jgi:hypothetical protein
MVIGHLHSIELSCNVNVRCSLDNELLKYPPDDRDFFFRPWPEPHTVRFQGLAFALRQPAFRMSLLIDHLPVESERERATNAIAEASYPAVPGVHLHAKLPAILSRHHTFDVLDDARQQASIVVELFSAVGNLDAVSLADKLVMRTLVDVLEASPPTDIVDQDVIEVRFSCLNILDQFDQARPPVDPHSAASFVDISPNDSEIALLSVCRDGGCLVLYRIALKFG